MIEEVLSICKGIGNIDYEFLVGRERVVFQRAVPLLDYPTCFYIDEINFVLVELSIYPFVSKTQSIDESKAVISVYDFEKTCRV